MKTGSRDARQKVILANQFSYRGPSVMMRLALSTLSVLVITTCLFAQEERKPATGYEAGASYSISDIENVNLQNGNLILNIPLASLSSGRGTSPGYTVGLQYNSKIWNSQLQHKTNGLPDQNGQTNYTKELLVDSEEGGWSLNSAGYVLNVVNRMELEDLALCTAGNDYAYSRSGYAFKVQMKTPEGKIVTFRPYGSGVAFSDPYADDFFSIDPTGLRHIYSLVTMNQGASCGYSTQQIVTTGMNYYSSDGSGMRLFLPPGTGATVNWKLYMSDGKLVENGPIDDSTIMQRITDRNGNKLVWKAATINGMDGIKIQNDVGKYVFVSNVANDENKIITEGFNGALLETKVHWKTYYVYRAYTTTTAYNAPQSERVLESLWGLINVDKITLPSQAGDLEYNFTYNASETEPQSHTTSWGELKTVSLPSEAQAEYSYDWEISTGALSVQNILKLGAMRRALKYYSEYDGNSQLVTEYTNYGNNSFTSPDGGKHLEVMSWDTSFRGYNCRTINPDGSISEKIWARNAAPNVSGGTVNAYVKTAFTSIPDSTGNPVLTAITDYDYDKNGNVLEIREYDWVAYSSVPRIGNGINLKPIGLPGNLTLKRKTVNTYYNPTPIATDITTASSNNYADPSSPRLHNIIKSSEVRDGGDIIKSRTEFYYDDPSNRGNLKEVRAWDSTKDNLADADSNGSRLNSNNSISTYTDYDSYGNPTLITDANGNRKQIVYGDISGPNGSVAGLYPTQTKTAYGTAVERTATAAYDFHTGLVTSSTDVDNSLTNAAEFDALGRPTKAITAQGTALESWVRTEYSAEDRRVIVRADLEAKGDGKKVAIQHFDQLGRVRLSRMLEDAAAGNPYNEADGIKVQTRYRYNAPTDPDNSDGAYTLTSNSYRAANSSAASSEQTMGWTLSYINKTGKHSETTTFAGTGLPEPWGSNSSSTGTIKTDADTDRVLATDQAGKQRVSKTNVLGQLSGVWEITPQDSATVAVTFAGHSEVAYGYQTNYGYDISGNLTTVTQGSQTRTFTYSSLERLTSATNPESGTITYKYDANGNLTQKSQPRNGTVTIITADTYDPLNRITQRSYAGDPNYTTPAVAYTYDNKPHARGKLTQINSSVSNTEYTGFDLLGRVTSHKQTTDGRDYTTGYAYDLSGALVEETYPSTRKVKNILDNNGDLSVVQSKKNSGSGYWSYAGSFNYTAAGAVSSMQLGNGHWQSTSFNSRLQPTQIALGTTLSAADLLDLTYSYGTNKNNGNVLSQTITTPATGNNPGFVATQNYTYDSLNRLSQATETIPDQTGWQQSYLYDRFGNRRFDTANNQTTTLEANCPAAVCNPEINPANNKLVSAAYDSSGNTTTDVSSNQYVYDGENKMVQAKDPSGDLIGQYWYDGGGMRIKKYVPATNETTVFLYDVGGKLVAEYSTQLSSDPQVSYLTSDILETPRVNTNAGGAVIARHDYHPFGEEIVSSQRTPEIGYDSDEIRQKFTSKQRDLETDLDYFEARYYSNSLGRFSSVDPVNLTAERLVDPQRINLFAYTRNNPLKFVDPNGEDVISIEVIVKGPNQLAKNDPKWKSQEAGRAEDLGGVVNGGNFVYAVNIVVTVTSDDSPDNYEPEQKSFVIALNVNGESIERNSDPLRPGEVGVEKDDDPEEKNVLSSGNKLIWYDNPGFQATNTTQKGVNGQFVAIFASTVKPKKGTDGKATGIVCYWGVKLVVVEGRITAQAVRISKEDYEERTGKSKKKKKEKEKEKND